MYSVREDAGTDNQNLRVKTTCGLGSRLFFVVLGCGFWITGLTATDAVQAQAPVSPGGGAVPAAPQTGGDDEWERVSARDYSERLELPVVNIRVVGLETIPEEAVLQKVTTSLRRRPSKKRIDEDVKALYQSRWFYNVEPFIRKKGEGLELIFKVKERPIVGKIEYRGNKKIKDKILADLTGLRPGSPYDISSNRESVERIKNYYIEKGYRNAEVKLISGDKQSQRDVVFQIQEGYKVKVKAINLEGCKFVNTGVLKTKLSTKKGFGVSEYRIGGLFDPETIQNDVDAIIQYYRTYGFFDVKVDRNVEFNDKKSMVTLNYRITEGPRYKIRNVVYQGNEVLSDEEISKLFNIGEGDHFNGRVLAKDIRELKKIYGAQGRFYNDVQAVPRFLEQPGVADLIFEIDEDKVRYWRNIDIHILGDYPHTKASTARNILKFEPGDLADPEAVRLAQRGLGGSQVFEKNPRLVPVRGDESTLFAGEGVMRGQMDDDFIDIRVSPVIEQEGLPEIDFVAPDKKEERIEDTKEISEENSLGETSSWFGHSRFSAKMEVSETKQTLPESIAEVKPAFQYGHSLTGTADTQNSRETIGLVAAHTRPKSSLFTAEESEQELDRSLEKIFRNESQPIFRAQSDDTIFDPSLQQVQFEDRNNPMMNPSPDGDPYGNRFPETSPMDLDIYLNEARTGRFMFGVGINSDTGPVGNIVLEEQNFDLFRPPTSFQDVVNGTAWRGAGQRFRLEAVPGDQVSRYVVSWSDPNFADTDYSFGLSGFYFTRFYPDWDEERLGGRITLGKQLTPEWSVSGALRLEQVELTDPSVPTPAELAAAEGVNTLSTLRGTITHDTRDSSFMTGEGHLLEFSYEQAVGDFTYSQFMLEASQYFTVYSRPDGGGRHIISLGGQAGWTGSDTPIYEQFYAGGYQTFRGFAFRGVGPVELDVNTGGEFLALGSLEYIFPIMANETVQTVVFSDFGTVDNDANFDSFRMSVGGGLRITVPAMGPVPLAFDWAYPILKEDFDEKRLFSFYVGFTR